MITACNRWAQAWILLGVSHGSICYHLSHCDMKGLAMYSVLLLRKDGLTTTGSTTGWAELVEEMAASLHSPSPSNAPACPKCIVVQRPWPNGVFDGEILAKPDTVR